SVLQEGGLPVTLLDHRPERAERLRREGLRLREGPAGKARRVKLACTTAPRHIAGVGLVILCTKAQHTAAALGPLAARLGPECLVWTVQNGLGNLEVVEAAVGPRRALGGTTGQGAYWDNRGALVHAGRGPTRLGAAAGPPDARLLALARTLTGAGLPVEPVADVRRELWLKAVVAASALPLTALFRVTNGELAARAELRRAAEALLDEALEVAARQGLALAREEALARLWDVVGASAANRSSMLSDVLAGRETEVEALNGALARLGPAPRHALVAELVRALHPRGVP
ncbi:MAG TPA: 2-dehydropantoate 2-reductase, partial [Myxococcota bacterium]|nr:2-dehydropantoate 2-reductase [Myxococcota bacterium]